MQCLDGMIMRLILVAVGNEERGRSSGCADGLVCHFGGCLWASQQYDENEVKLGGSTGSNIDLMYLGTRKWYQHEMMN